MIWVNGKLRELTAEETAEIRRSSEQAEREYWLNASYDDAVNSEIRKRYTESQEFSILRQKYEKPEEYAVYYAYCEECKTFVKAKKAEYA